MAFANFFLLLDDITALLDDVATMTKVAANKTAGVLGDDLALNAQQVSGVNAERELPVVWAVAKGSLLNKLILVPLALLISFFIPWAITPLLMLGGLYLCFEGFEKIAHRWLHSEHEDQQHVKELKQAIADPKVDLVQFEKEKIQSAIRTDFVLSGEIIVITLGVVAQQDFLTQVFVLFAVAIAMTFFVYGLVAGIVRLDDLGLRWVTQNSQNTFAAIQRRIGRGLLLLAPRLMKTLTIVGTAAMFMVGGSILAHGWHGIHDLTQYLQQLVLLVPVVGSVLSFLTPLVLEAIFGVLAGGLAVLMWTLLSGLISKMKS